MGVLACLHRIMQVKNCTTSVSSLSSLRAKTRVIQAPVRFALLNSQKKRRKSSNNDVLGRQSVYLLAKQRLDNSWAWDISTGVMVLAMLALC